MLIHRLTCTHPDGSQTAATLAIHDGRLLVISMGEADALNHYPVIRGTPHLRVRPDIIEDYKQKEAQFMLFPLDEVLTWTEYAAYALDAVSVSRLTDDALHIDTPAGTHQFGLRLVDGAAIREFAEQLRG